MFDALRKLKHQAIEAAQASLDRIDAQQQYEQQRQYGVYNVPGPSQQWQGNSAYVHPANGTGAPTVMSQGYSAVTPAHPPYQPGNCPPQPQQQYCPEPRSAQAFTPQVQPAGPPGTNTYGPNQPPPASMTSPVQQANMTSFSWGNLINPDRTASRQFVLLLDAIFHLADTTLEPRNTGILEPPKAATLFEAMNYSDSNNIPKSFYQFAVQNHYPDPLKLQADAMAMNWRIFQIPYHTNNANVVGLTREGFRAIILRDALVDPVVQWKRLDTFLSTNHSRLVNPETRLPFPASTIPEGSLPTTGDPETMRICREREKQMSAEFLQYQQALMGAQNWKHQATMDGLTAGYFTPNAWGSYQFHATRGMNW
ncbi:hypothetical protein G7Z17_g4802 [Cylindrodendrum hubeiense]|uniref:DUF7514 domain-containing protein n=1 Tax=Cylindrodendrum hubeiense TaxID=595255 RepID=A0A9P5HDC0_9HYPO|nr:hypothetical protein G7Z17_g4802 [Cylindrodendrum hubeiense]